MEKVSIGIAGELARLFAATIFELRGEWWRLHRAPPPMRLSRDLLMRGITYKLQGEAARRPLQINPAQAGRFEPRLRNKQRAQAPADFVEGWDTAYTRMARYDSYRACPGARVRMDGRALPVSHHHRP
jgi:hypothetical protein